MDEKIWYYHVRFNLKKEHPYSTLSRFAIKLVTSGRLTGQQTIQLLDIITIKIRGIAARDHVPQAITFAIRGGRVGAAFCSSGDNFNKMIGRGIATYRLFKTSWVLK